MEFKSKFFKEGKVVDIKTEESHIPFRKATILEVHPDGLVVTQEGLKDAPVRFFAYAQMKALEFCPSLKSKEAKDEAPRA